ncbi:MAG TPA: hypothetical protein DCQ16_04005 [Spirochaetaceae bacterium]|nr:hypothetical protein [Spirochaetaceae bacterium]
MAIRATSDSGKSACLEMEDANTEASSLSPTRCFSTSEATLNATPEQRSRSEERKRTTMPVKTAMTQAA